MNNRWLEPLAVTLVVVVWATLHWTFRDVFIFHDSWNHNFPQVYEVTKNSACGQLAYWLSSDTGTPTVIYGISFSLTQMFRIALMNWWACTHPAPFDAMLYYKVQIFVIYLGFAFGMYVLGRSLFRRWVSALYLMTATLFAGACLESLHADEIAIMMFWVPWCTAALALALRHVDSYRGALYANLAALFFCMELLDMYPHMPTLAALCATAIYIALWPQDAMRAIVKLLPRMWPALIVVALTAGGLYAIHQQIFDFQPQHSRIAITVRPSEFGETGFTQPSGFFGTLFPLTFTAAFEDLAWRYASRGFIFRLDLLILFLGTLPILLAIALIPRRGFTRTTVGWLLFVAVLTAISMQPTKLYFVIFHLPFFDLFRQYFHFFDYALIAFLVLSAYGFERLITSSVSERVAILRTTITLASGLVVFGIVALIVFVPWGMDHGPGLPAYFKWIAGDVAIIAVALGAIYVGTRSTISSNRFALVGIFALIVTQAFHAASMYGLLGEPAEVTFARNKMDQRLLTPLDAAEWNAPGRITRASCEKTTGCNLALRPAASLKTDTSGAFFRDLQSPVLRKVLPDSVKSALAGVSHPILWATGSLTALPSLEALDDTLAQYRGDPADLLTRTTYVVGAPQGAAAATTAPAEVHPSAIEFSDMKLAPNQISFRYRAGAPGYANLSLTASPGWSVQVAGAPAQIIRSYYNFVAVGLPAGEGQVVLVYRDAWAAYFFNSRTVLALLALFGLALVAWQACRRTERTVSADR